MHVHSRSGLQAIVSVPVTWWATNDPSVFAASVHGARYELRAEPGPHGAALTRWRVYRDGKADGGVLRAAPTHVLASVSLAVALGGEACPCGCTARIKATVAANV